MEKTNFIDKIPSDIKYYLLGWKDRNRKDFESIWGETRLRDLSKEQLKDLFSYATEKDKKLI
jgi:hypothetical protein